MTAEEISGRATWFEAVLACHQERIQLYSELPEKIVYFVRDDLDYEAKALKNLQKKPEVVDYLQPFWMPCRHGPAAFGAARPAEADQGIPFPTKKENDVPTGTPFTPPALLEEKAPRDRRATRSGLLASSCIRCALH
jgi:hypothetical protein